MVKVCVTNHNVGRVEDFANHNTGGFTFLSDDLGNARVAVHLGAMIFSEALYRLNDCVETTLWVKDANIHVNVGHQMVHARGVVGAGTQEHRWEVQNFTKTVVLHMFGCERVEGTQQVFDEVTSALQNLRVGERAGVFKVCVEEVID